MHLEMKLRSIGNRPLTLSITKDGNVYPRPKTRWVFTLLGHGHRSLFRPMGLLMGKFYTHRVCRYGYVPGVSIPANPWVNFTWLMLYLVYSSPTIIIQPRPNNNIYKKTWNPRPPYFLIVAAATAQPDSPTPVALASTSHTHVPRLPFLSQASRLS
jgi:hypothetical protein